jgi:electron transport complex protein RnfB
MVTLALLLIALALAGWAWRDWLVPAAPPVSDAHETSLVDQIDALLPQTQCGQCGFPGCRPYAEAIVRGEATINRCAPGGARGIEKLAALLGQAVVPLDPAYGHEKPSTVAVIHEDACIGCTKCIDACPVDAIIGASKLMHTVMSDVCTGCGLCVPACPVDCIDMMKLATNDGTAESRSAFVSD